LIDTWLREDLASVANDALKDGVVPGSTTACISAQYRRNLGEKRATALPWAWLALRIWYRTWVKQPVEARAPRFADYNREAFELLSSLASDHARQWVHGRERLSLSRLKLTLRGRNLGDPLLQYNPVAQRFSTSGSRDLLT
jgi:hypothetical protein